MKSSLLSMLLVFSSVYSFSQIERGTWSTSGFVSLGAAVASEGSFGISTGLTARVGYTPLKNWMVGTGLSGHLEFYRMPQENQFTFREGGELFTRYYFNVGKEKSKDERIWKTMAFYPEVSVGVHPFFGQNAGVGLGAAFFISPRLSIDASVKYLTPLNGSPDRITTPIALSYYFGRK